MVEIVPTVTLVWLRTLSSPPESGKGHGSGDDEGSSESCSLVTTVWVRGENYVFARVRHSVGTTGFRPGRKGRRVGPTIRDERVRTVSKHGGGGTKRLAQWQTRCT